MTITLGTIPLVPKRYRLDLGVHGRRTHPADRARIVRSRRRPGRSFVLSASFRPGAGYVTWSDDRSRVVVHGWVAFLAWDSGSRRWARGHRTRRQTGLGLLAWYTPLEVGVTRNGNRCPYLTG